MHLVTKLLFLLYLIEVSYGEIVIKATAGDTATLSCSTEPGTTVSWKFRRQSNGTEELYIVISGNIVESYKDRLSLVEDAENPGYYTLFISDVIVGDSGSYYCIDNGGLGKRSPVHLAVTSGTSGLKSTPKADAAASTGNMNSTTIGLIVAVIILALLLATGGLIFVIVCQRRANRHKAATASKNGRRQESLALSVDDYSPVAVTFQAPPTSPGSRGAVAASLFEHESRVWVNGLMVYDGYIVALRGRELQFYESTKYIAQRTVTLPSRVYKHFRNDMVLRQTNNEHHLYIADYFNKDIYRFALPLDEDAEHAKVAWSVEFRPSGLSITLGKNILITCSEARKLIEFTPDGKEVLAKISLISEVEWPLHAVEIQSDEVSAKRRFVVCHSGDVVKIVGERGETFWSYYGSHESGQSCYEYLASPCHIAVDEDAAFIYVADEFNDRVLALSFDLKFQREFVLREIHRPRRLFLHGKRLYIGQWNGHLKYVDT